MFPSVKAVEAALSADCPSADAKLLLVILCSYVDARLQCFPALSELARRCHLKSETTVRKHLKALVDAGLLRIDADTARNGRRTSNVYTVLLAVPGLTPAPPADMPRRQVPHSIRPRRTIARPAVDKSVSVPAITPQNMRGHPTELVGTYPTESEGLEPNHMKKKGETPEPQGPVASGYDGLALKGRRYALPAGPVRAIPGPQPTDDADRRRLQHEMAERLRALPASGG